jgi:hypothetical protein
VLFHGCSNDNIGGVYPCHGFLVIACVVDTGNKFIAGDNNTDEQLYKFYCR